MNATATTARAIAAMRCRRSSPARSSSSSGTRATLSDAGRRRRPSAAARSARRPCRCRARPSRAGGRRPAPGCRSRAAARAASPRSSAPPPVRTMPRVDQVAGELRRAPVEGRADRADDAVDRRRPWPCAVRRRRSVTLRGRPEPMSRPRISARCGPATGNAEPRLILSSSAVRSPISSENSARTCSTIASSSASPATRRLVEATTPPSASTATSVVPPPMSTIIDPDGWLTGRPAPIAAAIGSEMMCTLRAPAAYADSLTARCSTLVMPRRHADDRPAGR